MSRAQFPPDFRWGVATSAFQIEGAVAEGGRGRSIWDTFTATPGAIAHGEDAAVAADHYHRYVCDVDLMRELGVGAYHAAAGTAGRISGPVRRFRVGHVVRGRVDQSRSCGALSAVFA